MKGVRRLIPPSSYTTDDYNRNTSEMRRLPMVTGDGGLMVGRYSYDLVKHEREAEGLRCPKCEELPIVFKEGVWS